MAVLRAGSFQVQWLSLLLSTAATIYLSGRKRGERFSLAYSKSTKMFVKMDTISEMLR